MKTLLTCVLFVVSASTASAQSLTKAQVIRAVAKAVVGAGHGNRVETCGFITDRSKLLACVMQNAASNGEFYKLPSNKVILNPVTFSFLDSSNDCGMEVQYQPRRSPPITVGAWDCY
jgi:hypothetical protein